MSAILCKLLFHPLLLLLIPVLKLQFNQAHAAASIVTTISKDQFPPGFVFGAGTSALQIEGAAFEDGRKPSTWDTFAHAGKIRDNTTGDVAADQYHKYKDDVKLMHDIGLDAYRFSISWSRLIPGIDNGYRFGFLGISRQKFSKDGRGAINAKGLQYYNNLIDELISYGIEAHVTLVHFDIPQALEDEYGGLLSPKIIDDFMAYADVCFREFGDRVSSWSTFNEPNVFTVLGYDVGLFPPERCSYPFGRNCSNGNSSIEVYITAHNILLSHAAAANLYRENYQEKQRGSIGITLFTLWFEPLTNSSEDAAATQRVVDFQLGWFLDPLVYGDYPATMRKIVGSRLPSLSKDESKRLKGSFDYIGLNHYTVISVEDYHGGWDKGERDYLRDVYAKISFNKGLITSDKKDHNWLKGLDFLPLPWGLQRLLEYIRLNYKNPAVIIHENGFPSMGNISLASELEDVDRVNYLRGYIEDLLPSLRNGSNVEGYFVWSFLDCFEIINGYSSRFGLVRVDYNDKDLKRYPRLSAHWYSNFLGKNRMNWEIS